MSTALDTVRRYLRHLHEGDTAGLVSCFEPDGVVHSPFLGTLSAQPFFDKLAASSSASVITPIDLLVSADAAPGAQRVAAWFRYDWTLRDGQQLSFTCVDVFSFGPGSDRIAQMHIVYDTHPLREQVGDKYAISGG